MFAVWDGVTAVPLFQISLGSRIERGGLSCTVA
jgi:hypothetical protein